MTKAKMYRGHRMTLNPKPGRNPERKCGRPRQSYKRYRFEQTHLGFFLKYEVPVIYDILVNLTPPMPIFEPPYLLIRKVCASSSDPSLKKPKFERYLQEYKQCGLYCRRAVKLTPVKAAYYKGIRERKLQQFILKNQMKINHMLKKKT